MTQRAGLDQGRPKPIRERHKELTRELILETFARMVVEDGLHDVTIQQVADRVGVAHRTVYRHFKNRQDLVDKLADWLVERSAARGGVDYPDEHHPFPEAVELNYRLFDEEAELTKALALITWGRGATLAEAQNRRSRDFSKYLEPFTHHLTPVEARAINALFRYLASSQSWLVFRERFGLEGKDMGPTLAWAFRVLLEALRQQNTDPSTTQPEGESNP